MYKRQLILEDNPYGDLRYSGEFIPNIKRFDEDEIVIYCGSFSKVVGVGKAHRYFPFMQSDDSQTARCLAA